MRLIKTTWNPPRLFSPSLPALLIHHVPFFAARLAQTELARGPGLYDTPSPGRVCKVLTAAGAAPAAGLSGVAGSRGHII